MKDKLLDLKTLPLVGFEFIAEYWMKVNDQINNIKKRMKRIKVQEKVYSWQKDTEYNKVEEDDQDDPPFSVWRDPENFVQVELIEAIVLQSEVPEVYNRAISFLIYMYTALEKDMRVNEKRGLYLQLLIQKFINLISGDNPSSALVKRVMLVLNNIIRETEKCGAADVRPHNTKLKGEMFDRIIINNLTSIKAENTVVKIFTSATVWEFRQEVSRLIDLSPKYV